jgi:UPF0755 protein
MKTKDRRGEEKRIKKMPKAFSVLLTTLSVLVCIILAGLAALLVYIPKQTESLFGPPSTLLSPMQTITLSVRITLFYKNDLTTRMDIAGKEQSFIVNLGESVGSITARMEENGLVRSGEALRLYLIYSGLDSSVQAGDYVLSPTSTAVEIARRLQDATPAEVTFVILPGWRVEEVAASLPTSGISITPDDFIQTARDLTVGIDLGLPTESVSFEGFLFPDSYRFKREITPAEMVRTMLSDFMAKVTPEIRQGMRTQGLDLYQGVILASIVQREAIVIEEQPMIASVFYNRLAAGMTLGSDPTIQYALGYDDILKTWWKNPLSSDDLKYDSPYNTYIYKGLPPGPIANPSLSSLQAVAFPAKSPYYYFRATCDGSRRHRFAITLEEHLNNACP